MRWNNRRWGCSKRVAPSYAAVAAGAFNIGADAVKKGKGNSESFVKLENEMTDSAAWTALSDSAVWLYIEFMKQFKYETEFSRLILPFSKVSWRMSRGTFYKKIKELIKYGFIRIVSQGGLYKKPNVYALSNRWEEKSIKIVDKEGREAIRSGIARKPSSKNNLSNLKGKRKWER